MFEYGINIEILNLVSLDTIMIKRRIKRKVKREIQFYKVSICWFYVLYTFITWINMQFFQNVLLKPSSFCLLNPFFERNFLNPWLVAIYYKMSLKQCVLHNAKNIDKWEWKSHCLIIQGNRIHRCWIRQVSLYIIMCFVNLYFFRKKVSIMVCRL